MYLMIGFTFSFFAISVEWLFHHFLSIWKFGLLLGNNNRFCKAGSLNFTLFFHKDHTSEKKPAGSAERGKSFISCGSLYRSLCRFPSWEVVKKVFTKKILTKVIHRLIMLNILLEFIKSLKAGNFP